jgi:hypothetical protein
MPSPRPKTLPVALAGWREIGGKRCYFRSKMEMNYARYLEWLKQQGVIADWEHEKTTYWFEPIKRGVRSYLPDFHVTELNGSWCLHETKGYLDSKSRTKLKRMAKYYPEIKLILIDAKQYRAIKASVAGMIPEWE